MAVNKNVVRRQIAVGEAHAVPFLAHSSSKSRDRWVGARPKCTEHLRVKYVLRFKRAYALVELDSIARKIST